MTVPHFSSPAAAIAEMKRHAAGISELFLAPGATAKTATLAAEAYLKEHAEQIRAINLAGKSMHAASQEAPPAVLAARKDMAAWMGALMARVGEQGPEVGAAFGAVIAKLRS